MTRKLDDLAARFRAALDADADRRAAEEAERAARLAEASAARDVLLADLRGFADQVGLQVTHDGEALVWSHGDRSVQFMPKGPGDRLGVTWEERQERTGRLYREAALSNRWVLAVHGPRDEERLPWFDVGLVRIMVQGLGVPPPVADVVATHAEPDGTEGNEDTGRRL